MSIKLQLPKLTDLKPRINVIGVGGAGCNAINNMISAGLTGVQFVVANTDAQALAASSAEHRLQLGINLTEGLGAGSKPEIGEAAAEEAIEEIRSQIAGSHMVFIAAGMGGGTGTGAAGVIARAAKELGILTVGIITKPFHFEGARRMRIAEVGIAEIRKHVDTLIVIPNQNLFRVANEKTTFAEAFVLADQVLYSGVACIVDLIIKEGLINLDFADVRTVMSGMGSAVMGTGEASGERRASIAAEEAIANPLLDDVSLKGARGLLLSITGGRDLTLYEVDEAASRVRQEVDPEANIIVGATFDETLGDRVRVSIVASGMARQGEAAPMPPPVDPRVRAARAHAPMPPPPRQEMPRGFQHAQSHEEDMQRRLSEAIGVSGEDPAREQQREVWRAPGNVVIEEGFSHMSWPRQQAQPAGGPATGNQPTGQFIPAPPAELRRGARRMPDVEDFPPVAQREYRAKTGHAAQPTPPPPPQPASEGGQRRGILQRIIGRARREDTDDPPTSNAAPDPRRMSNSASDDWWAAERDSQGADEQDERAPLPEFFNRQR
ncbi:MAG: cell division protein FtsZ [Hyphomicrobium sp.]|uniref:cell division protein FtsZ n=1 Tax=Hyphomicrobium sp. TaxID=82 RepID=UPI00132500A7|nr:cell division protein FtsZ [Hyphomicrobium sp.]KAB2937894.1 MAG: cell division protein FtsZ [Hyphomicrobium sp.]MBZ0210690.1 cell division protein FtsZ [Hyphomicrobium sp.]MCZ7595499.1 cell division protein FtsZ [Hyphomicrobium sp.]